MDSAVLLDLLGNENRRRILRLLSHKPCYVTEISDYLGVSPKAVIDHLRKLEEAGLIESRSDDRRRKYFHISRGVRLEVSVSPYSFATKSAYPANPSLEVGGRCSHLSLNLRALDADPNEERSVGPRINGGRTPGDEAEATPEPTAAADASGGSDATQDGGCGDSDRPEPSAVPPGEEVAALATEFAELETLQHELSLAQRWVDGRITEVLDRLSERMAVEADSRFLAEVLAAVVETDGRFEAIVNAVGADAPAVDDALSHLADRGLIARAGDRWRVSSASN